MPAQLLAGLLLLMAASTLPGQAGAAIWDTQMAAGNTALAQSDLPGAEQQFRLALETARDFPGHDLRKAAARRGLARVLALWGDYSQAERLYRSALKQAVLALGSNHALPAAIRADLEALQRQREAAHPPRKEPPVPVSTWSSKISGASHWIGNHAELGLQPMIPILGGMAESNQGALAFTVGLHLPLKVGPTWSLGVDLSRFSATLPAKHALNSPVSLLGMQGWFRTGYGVFGLDLGGGMYRAKSGSERSLIPGVQGAVRLNITGANGLITNTPLNIALQAGVLQLLSGVRETGSAATLLRAGLLIGITAK